jgi:hypothetical protein
LTTFDPPGAVNSGSFPTQITPNGVIFGVYFDANGNALGFMRDSSGAFTEITGPNGLSGQYDFSVLFARPIGAALSSNPGGEIAGTYFEPIAGDPFGGNQRVFLLSKHGQYTTFDAANYPPCYIFSAPTGINPGGTVTGMLNDGFCIYRGFLRTPDGAVSIFDTPVAGTRPSPRHNTHSGIIHRRLGRRNVGDQLGGRSWPEVDVARRVDGGQVLAGRPVGVLGDVDVQGL